MIFDREMKLVVGDKDRDIVIKGTNVIEAFRENPAYTGLAPLIDELMEVHLK